MTAERVTQDYSDDELGRRPGVDLRQRFAVGDVVSRPQFRLLSFDEAAQPRASDYLIQGIQGKGSLGLMFGPPKQGKTFIALDKALTVACGSQWGGRRTAHGHVIYLLGEGTGRFWKRIQAWNQDRDPAQLKMVREFFHFFPQSITLTAPSDLDQLIALAKGLPAPGLVLLVVDTLARAMGLEDENDTKAMNAVVRAADTFRAETGAAVELIHHTPKSNEETYRGSSVLGGAVDTMASVTKTADGKVRMRSVLSRDDEPFPDLYFQLSSVLVVQEGDGVPVTSCKVTITGGEDEGCRWHPELTGNHLVAIRKLRDGRFEDGTSYTQWNEASGLPEGSFDAVRKWLLAKGWVLHDGKGRKGRYRVSPKFKEPADAV